MYKPLCNFCIFRLLEFRGADPVFAEDKWISVPVAKGDLVLIHGRVRGRVERVRNVEKGPICSQVAKHKQI